MALNDRQIAEYFHRSYTAVDGLWFMKLEELSGFDTALDVDTAVWKVMPKIQARKLKELTGRAGGLDGLRECFTTKLDIEGYAYTAAELPEEQGFEVRITSCPWLELLARSNRQHLADTIGQAICTTEYGVWAREFGETLAFEFGERICQGCSTCVLRFRSRDAAEENS